ncbi:MAG: hypothetical protein FRX48_08429 [Lasallia pustulata]|uniref:Uncharacterized protein n=1 Tax=Lasallia pustulata TaxID=136370 RepID=A0A5M8PE63_9LECA|nr:MAG: hypothetical protein FRX48_08429 [Lasallia pustulata]
MGEGGVKVATQRPPGALHPDESKWRYRATVTDSTRRKARVTTNKGNGHGGGKKVSRYTADSRPVHSHKDGSKSSINVEVPNGDGWVHQTEVGRGKSTKQSGKM